MKPDLRDIAIQRILRKILEKNSKALALTKEEQKLWNYIYNYDFKDLIN